MNEQKDPETDNNTNVLSSTNESSRNKVNQLSMLENNLQNLGMQRQQFQSQMAETESALGELEKSQDTYKILGNIMVKVEKEKLKKELDSKKETMQVRMQSLEKQEEKLREKAKTLQEEILQKIKRGEGGWTKKHKSNWPYTT